MIQVWWLEKKELKSVVRNLGVYLDNELSMSAHVNTVCSSCYYHLRTIRHIRPYLTLKAAKALVHSLISSRLDYCNSLLYGISESLIYKLQKIQNMAAKIVTNHRKFDHVTPLLRGLHWLPVKFRINYKVLLITYKALNGKAPSYISDMITQYAPERNLRSSTKYNLHQPRTKLKTGGDRAYCSAAPTLWNSLPLHIKTAPTVDQFKNNLKTHLFKQAYQC